MSLTLPTSAPCINFLIPLVPVYNSTILIDFKRPHPPIVTLQSSLPYKQHPSLSFIPILFVPTTIYPFPALLRTSIRQLPEILHPPSLLIVKSSLSILYQIGYALSRVRTKFLIRNKSIPTNIMRVPTLLQSLSSPTPRFLGLLTISATYTLRGRTIFIVKRTRYWSLCKRLTDAGGFVRRFHH